MDKCCIIMSDRMTTTIHLPGANEPALSVRVEAGRPPDYSILLYRLYWLSPPNFGSASTRRLSSWGVGTC